MYLGVASAYRVGMLEAWLYSKVYINGWMIPWFSHGRSQVQGCWWSSFYSVLQLEIIFKVAVYQADNLPCWCDSKLKIYGFQKPLL